jgi:hypothetical protein
MEKVQLNEDAQQETKQGNVGWPVSRVRFSGLRKLSTDMARHYAEVHRTRHKQVAPRIQLHEDIKIRHL